MKRLAMAMPSSSGMFKRASFPAAELSRGATDLMQAFLAFPSIAWAPRVRTLIAPGSERLEDPAGPVCGLRIGIDPEGYPIAQKWRRISASHHHRDYCLVR